MIVPLFGPIAGGVEFCHFVKIDIETRMVLPPYYLRQNLFQYRIGGIRVTARQNSLNYNILTQMRDRARAHSATLALCGFLFSLTGAAASAEECNSYAVRVATDPVPYQYPHGLAKVDALLATMPADADVVLIGDSLVANWPADLAHAQFGTANLWNFAVGGSTTQNTLWQLARIRGNSLAPGRVFVLVGTNNLTVEAMPSCAIAAGIIAISETVHDLWPAANIALMGIPPRGTDFSFRDRDRLAVNTSLKDWASGKAYMRYFAVDDDTMTCGQRNSAAPPALETLSRSRCENYADDFGHFRRPGYKVVFDAMTAQASIARTETLPLRPDP